MLGPWFCFLHWAKVIVTVGKSASLSEFQFPVPRLFHNDFWELLAGSWTPSPPAPPGGGTLYLGMGTLLSSPPPSGHPDQGSAGLVLILLTFILSTLTNKTPSCIFLIPVTY